MSWRYIVAVLVLALIPIVGAGSAAADEPDPKRAMELFGDAKRLHEEGRVRESMVKLQEAYEAYPSDAILVSIVNRHLDLGELEQAAELLEHIDAGKGKLKRQISRLKKRVAKALAQPVTVRLTANAVDAVVSIDGGEPVGLPARVELTRGRHRFAFTANGRSDVELVEMITGSTEVPISANLSVPIGHWRVTIEPPIPLGEIRLLLDGQAVRLGRSELDKPVSDSRHVVPGTHKLTCLRGFESRADADFTVASGDTVALTCTFPAAGSDISPWAWVTGGAGLAALATGIGLIAHHAVEMPQLEARFKDVGRCSLAQQLTSAGCMGAGGDWDSQYKIESNKPEFGWTFVTVGAALGVVSGLFFADVIE